MKLRLIIEKDTAILNVEAENTFEKDMIARIERFNNHLVTFNSEQSYGVTRSAAINVSFSTENPAPF